MKNIIAIKALIVLAMLAVLIPAVVWAQLPPNYSSLLLVKKGQLMKLVYAKSMTRQVAEMKDRFEKFEWVEPRDGECVPMRPDISVAVDEKEVAFSYLSVRQGQVFQVTAAYTTDDPFWRIADTVMYHGDKFRAPSLTHPPEL